MKIISVIAIAVVLASLSFAQKSQRQGDIVGRFQVITGPQGPLGAILIDTASGDTWLLKSDSTSIPNKTFGYWEPIMRLPK